MIGCYGLGGGTRKDFDSVIIKELQGRRLRSVSVGVVEGRNSRATTP